MRRSVSVTIVVATALAMVGCAAPHEQAKEQSQARWNNTRSNVLVQGGEGQFAAGDLDGAATSAREALALSPDLVCARMLMARVHIEKGSYTAAMDELARVEALDAADDRVPYLQAVVHERRGRYDDALALYEKARTLAPGNGAYVLAAAEVLVALGRADDALVLVESNLSALDDAGGAALLAGDLAMVVGRADKAVEYYRAARALEPTDPGLLEKLAKARFFAGDHKHAARLLAELAVLAPYDKSPWVHTMLGDALLATGQIRQARDAYYTVTQLDADEPRAWVNLATADLACRDFARAALAARRAMELDPSSAEATVLHGYALLAQGKADQAEQVLLQASSDHPADPMLQCLLGRSYSAMGRLDEAQDRYRATLALDPDNRIAQEMMSRLTP
ncbi:MAG: tetratricopeptide repeat protein [Planctomycetes bacterium]|nr:tetratricopeptide repeat protein [Planctomycetota bacterium]